MIASIESTVFPLFEESGIGNRESGSCSLIPDS
jgi:hypothetical protein